MENATINSNGAGDTITTARSGGGDDITDAQSGGGDAVAEVQSVPQSMVQGAVDTVTEAQSVAQSMVQRRIYPKFRYISFTQSVDEEHVRVMVRIWPEVLKSVVKHGLSGRFDPYARSVKVWATERTIDPDIIHKAWGCIILVSQAGAPARFAISGLDDPYYYDYIKTGYQFGGLAIVNLIDEDVYIEKRKCVYKYLKALAYGCLCNVKIHEDKDFMTVRGTELEHIRRFRNVVQDCFLEHNDPEAYAKELYYDRLRNTVEIVKDLKI